MKETTNPKIVGFKTQQQLENVRVEKMVERCACPIGVFLLRPVLDCRLLVVDDCMAVLIKRKKETSRILTYATILHSWLAMRTFTNKI